MTEDSDIISAKVRSPGKKRGARRLRRDGLVPAIAYGPSSQPRFLALDPKTFVQQRQRYGRSHLYTVHVTGSDDNENPRFKAIIQAIDRDPLTRQLRHVDLYAVDMMKPLHISVRLDLVGKPKGVVEGGLLTQVMRRVDLVGLPDRIPDFISFDVSGLGLGASAHLSDLQLPEGVKVTASRDEAIATVLEPKEAEKSAEEEEAAKAASA